MSVEIDQPEIEALIQQRMASGIFPDAEAVLIYALKTAPILVIKKVKKPNFAQFLLDSPLAGSNLELERIKDFSIPIEL